MISFDISGMRTLVVGGSSGIGYVLAREFSEAGAIVAIAAEVDEVHDAAHAITRETGHVVEGIKCDITRAPEVLTMVESIGEIDVLINNAGIFAETPIDQPDTNEWFRRIMDINVNGLYWVTQAVTKEMRDGGRVIFTASVWGRTAGPRFGAYVASKHAVLGLVKSLAAELGPRGITVNAVCPGSAATEMNLRQLPKDEVDKLTSQMQIHRGLIPPEAIAGMYVFLASPAGSEITGQGLHVDRGQYLGA